MFLRIENIYKTYPNSQKVLKGVNLEANQGETIVLLGLSGSGKTTLLRIIAGLELADKGNIYINDQSIDQVPVQHRNFGFVFQDYALFPYLNVSENIAFGLKLKKKTWTKKQIKNKVKELLDLVEMSELASRRIHQLSGGQKQRVAMARAIAIEPRMLLLDEPFSALDVQVRKNLRVATKKLQQQLKITSILVTHDQKEAFEMADKIAIMNQGQIEQFGTKKELFSNPKTNFIRSFIGKDDFEI